MASPTVGKERDVPRCVLAIDLGSGGPKVAVVSETGDVLATAFRPVPIDRVAGGGVEQDPELWWTAVKEAARAAVTEADIPSEHLLGVGCASQWSVTVAVDRQSKPLMPAIHWLDGRGAPYNQALVKGLVSLEGYGLHRTLTWIRLTGLAPTRSGVDALGHILFIKHERPDVYEAAYKFLEPQDFLTFRLTGRCTATQHSMVPALLVDNRTWGSTRYADTLIAIAGIDPDKLPELIPNDGVVGTILPDVARDLGVSPEARVIAGANDTSCSAIGAGATEPFEGVIYIGTSQVLTCHLPHKRTDPLHMIATMPSPLPGKHLLLAEQGAGGKCIEFFLNRLVYGRDAFAEDAVTGPDSGDDTGNTYPLPADAYTRFDRAASLSPPGANGSLFLPWLTGALAPDEDASIRGAFLNLSLDTSRADLARAILEGLAFNSRWTMEAARKTVGRGFSHIRLAGGGARCRTWAGIHADILGLPIHLVANPTDVTLRGAAFLAMDRLGIRTLDDLSTSVAFDRVVEPDSSRRQVYDQVYHQWRRLQKSTKPVFRGLNS